MRDMKNKKVSLVKTKNDRKPEQFSLTWIGASITCLFTRLICESNEPLFQPYL